MLGVVYRMLNPRKNLLRTYTEDRSAELAARLWGMGLYAESDAIVIAEGL